MELCKYGQYNKPYDRSYYELIERYQQDSKLAFEVRMYRSYSEPIKRYLQDTDCTLAFEVRMYRQPVNGYHVNTCHISIIITCNTDIKILFKTYIG